MRFYHSILVIIFLDLSVFSYSQQDSISYTNAPDTLIHQRDLRAPCSSTPIAGIVSSSADKGCSGYSIEVELNSEGFTTGFSGLSFRWMKSLTGTGGWTSIAGATDPSELVYTATATTYFQLEAVCTNTGETDYSDIVTYIAEPCTEYRCGSTSSTIYTCNALFFDSGGGAQYSDNENTVMKFCSGDGRHLKIDFLTFSTEDNAQSGRYQERYDKLKVFRGPNISFSPMFEFSGNQTPENQVPIIISSGQCISFNFVSDGSVVKDGWVAHVSCTDEENNIASQYCDNAPTICNLDGYEGNTCNFYNIERVNDQIQDEGVLFPGLSALDNNSFIRFIASASQVVLEVTISDCEGAFADPGGIQFAVYKGSSCVFEQLVSNPNYINPGLEEGNHNITINGLNAGTTYYLMVDGNYGAMCNYTIRAESGVALAQLVPNQSTLCDGEEATLTAIGGTSYEWSGPEGFSATTQSITVTDPGQYIVTITGGPAACPDEAVLSGIVNVIYDFINPIFNLPSFYCRGAAPSSLPQTSTNGVSGTWTPTLNPNLTTQYTFTAAEGFCSDPFIHTIVISPDLTTSSTAPNCNGENGKIIFSSQSQEFPLSFTVNGDIASSPYYVPAGNYTVKVTDVHGCTYSKPVTITEPEKLEISAEIMDSSCFGAKNTDIVLSGNGGTLPYSFSLIEGELVFQGFEFYDLNGSTYIAKVIDEKNCLDSMNILLSEPASIDASYITSNPSCTGNDDGYIELSIYGGTEPYYYNTGTITGPGTIVPTLEQGIYDIEIIDANGCSYTVYGISLTDIPGECLWIPNAFTPNGDGINDNWEIRNLHIYDNAIFQIFNRWGQEIYFGFCDDVWNGKSEWGLVPAGNYVYTLNLNNGTEPVCGIVSVVY